MKEGPKEFCIGALKGISGVVTKPISGVFYATAKVAEGVSNTFTTFDDKPRELRIRYPRAFYYKEKFYKEYVS